MYLVSLTCCNIAWILLLAYTDQMKNEKDLKNIRQEGAIPAMVPSKEKKWAIKNMYKFFTTKKSVYWGSIGFNECINH